MIRRRESLPEPLLDTPAISIAGKVWGVVASPITRTPATVSQRAQTTSTQVRTALSIATIGRVGTGPRTPAMDGSPRAGHNPICNSSSKHIPSASSAAKTLLRRWVEECAQEECAAEAAGGSAGKLPY